LNINLIGEGKIRFEKPDGKIMESSQGKIIHAIIIENIIQRSEKIKNDYRDAKGDNETAELIVLGKKYIPFAGFYHSITITLRQARCSRLFATPPSALPP
jgi:hypothetical protein